MALTFAFGPLKDDFVFCSPEILKWKDGLFRINRQPLIEAAPPDQASAVYAGQKTQTESVQKLDPLAGRAWKRALSDAARAGMRLGCFALGSRGDYLFSTDEGFFYSNLKPRLPRLEKWIEYNTTQDNPKVTMGQEGSFWACSEKGFRWSGLPSVVEEAIQEQLGQSGWISKPVQVAWGVKGGYVIMFENGSLSYNLAGQYPELEKILREIPCGSIKHLSLNTFKSRQFFIAFDDGTAKWCVPDAWSSDIKIVVDLYSAPASTPLKPGAGKLPRRLNSLETRVEFEAGKDAIQIGEFAAGSGSVGETVGCIIS